LADGANIRRSRALASVAHLAPLHLGLDVHRDTISVGILAPGAAQLRLSARFRALAAPKNTKSIVAAAIARELAGFLWAEMVA
jgi:hypothetical protein